MCINKSFLWKNSLLLVILSVITSCYPLVLKSEKETDFAVLYPNISLSGYLELSLVEGLGPVDIRFPVDIAIENVSDQVILLPADSDHDLYVFNKDQKQWSPVKERMRYPNDGRTFLYPENNLEKSQFTTWALPIHPDLVIQDQPITVRTVIIGEIIEKDQPTGKKVGAYFDITFEP